MKKVILFFLIFFNVAMFHFGTAAEATSYKSEIGLTFKSDVAPGTQDSTNPSSSNSSTPSTNESTSSISSSNSSDSSWQTSDSRPSKDNTVHYPETGNNKPTKSGITSLLPSTGSKSSYLFLIVGFLIVFSGLAILIFRSYNAFKKKRK
ncbi:hypothetical protein DOK67_0002529 [Enterococcus sp. DIV0212c]|uniref:LPXTG cell wall anchor domain-containing protein n=1 Tax=Enterococcus sp. DIV0212c TaxID=2230867 RepID=UPI001A9A9137|nr:LPXTG cell wall anchor domain-containing protein [Enterococcus sp. DIV0212c]MBO1353541.1 LPXTG cell wall anchor domain-containing protein [Enterococcus sp. DIV0212c]